MERTHDRMIWTLRVCRPQTYGLVGAPRLSRAPSGPGPGSQHPAPKSPWVHSRFFADLCSVE
ncbi:hypothetical protein CROQUDRAFT_662911 [Cronartium quercuum f. sp. fusiforme G11]|uniref:Uncharacterized protein n=1 Tax=Cronartium quercuum f. sp. fusiforme G11 TaxID=708437 RepID=A0A9P6NDF7_9BASI|nr:hypothetical protein CROQUDRAFT_662911 [Cronartium quercuum f. sp. fusiforme G11]